MPYRRVIIQYESFLDWLFSQGTRVVEFLNTALLIGFTIPLIFNLEGILSSTPYPNIYVTGNPLWWGCMAILGFLQWFAMSRKGIHSNQVSGYILIVSGWVWAMVASLFLSKYPPLTPAPIVYLIIAFIDTVAGLYLLRLNKKVEDRFTKKG